MWRRCLGKYCRITTNHCQSFSHIWHFLMISYAQCVKVSLSLLLWLYIHTEHNSGLKVHPRVWYNGEMVHFSKKHLPYALPALFFLFTVTVGILPPILLLVYPLLNKVLDFLGLEDRQTIVVKFFLCTISHWQSKTSA